MASIDCKKFTAAQTGGLSVHFDSEKRLECNHENPHIDKSKTHLNSFHDCTGYSDMLRRQKDRVAKMDEIHPPERVRKDRITAVMMEIPVPKVISDKGLTDQFLQDTYAMIGEMVGKENMCGMTTHRDEVHDYIDHGGAVRTSLEHGHAMVVPYAHWTAKETVYDEDGKPIRDENKKILKQDVQREGVNAKHFLTRSFLKKLQDKMQEMVLEKYGISYQTNQEPLHMTVEDLKRQSARAAAIIDKAEQHAEQTKQAVNDLETKKTALEKQINVIESVSDYDYEAQDTFDLILQGQQMLRHMEYAKSKKLFKGTKEADEWIDIMREMLNELRDLIHCGINRLKYFEIKHNMPDGDRMSRFLDERNLNLTDQITAARAECIEQDDSGRNQEQQKQKEKTR